MRVLGISGSLREGSLQHGPARRRGGRPARRRRVRAVARLATCPPTTRTATPAADPAVAALRDAIAAADAVLIATPEYNGSVPGALKNALDWASRPFPDNALRDKPVAVIGASTGLFGAVWAQADLRKVLTAIGAAVARRWAVALRRP